MKFKVGDKVKIIYEPGSLWYGLIGEIKKYSKNSAMDYVVYTKEHGPGGFFEHELESLNSTKIRERLGVK